MPVFLDEYDAGHACGTGTIGGAPEIRLGLGCDNALTVEVKHFRDAGHEACKFADIQLSDIIKNHMENLPKSYRKSNSSQFMRNQFAEGQPAFRGWRAHHQRFWIKSSLASEDVTAPICGNVNSP
jgi:hypothetical protein